MTAAIAIFAADRIIWNQLKFENPTQTLGEVKLSEDERAALKAALSAEIDPLRRDLAEEWQAPVFRIKLLDLNGDHIPEVIVEAFGPPIWCGATGNCRFWVFRKSSKTYESLLVREDFDSYLGFAVMQNHSSGYPDLVFNQHQSAYQQSLFVYKFRNGKYRVSGCYEANWDRGDNAPASKVPIVTKCQ